MVSITTRAAKGSALSWAELDANFTALKAAVDGLLAAQPTVTLTSASVSHNEGNSGTTAYVFTITRSASVGAVDVPWAFAAGSTSADDYTGGSLPTGGTVHLNDGTATGTFTININGDTTVEPDETFTVSIIAPAGYQGGTTMSATGTVLNDDTAPAGAYFDFGPLTAGASLPTGLTRLAGSQAIVVNGSYGGTSVLQVQDDSSLQINASVGVAATWRVTLTFSIPQSGIFSVAPGGFENGLFIYNAAGNTFWWRDNGSNVNSATDGVANTLNVMELVCIDPTVGAMEMRVWAFGGSRPSSPHTTHTYDRVLSGPIQITGAGSSIIGSIRYESGV